MAAPELSLIANHLLQPWVAWFTASIRQGQEWLSHAFTTQADMFGSFTMSVLNSYTNNNRLTLDGHTYNRIALVSRQFFM